MGTASLLDDLDARGLLHDSTDREAFAARLAKGPITLYYGCDPTADSLHVGNLVGLLVLRRFQDQGHRPIALAGGATGMVGDPSGKSAERNLLDDETLARNVAAIKDQVRRVLGGDGAWTLVDNADWTRGVGLLEFLRDVGKHVTVNQMMAKESIRARLDSEQGISYTEFSYMLLQAFDFLVLHETETCELQIGGSDQWGNITAGIDLIRRRRGAHAFGLTWPLITRSDGRKFGKTEEGTVWLSAGRTSPYRFFQYFLNVPDADAGHFLRLFTFLAVDEIGDLEARSAADPGRREAQRVLAGEVTAIVHGPEAAAAAAEASAILFGGAPQTASAATLESIAGEVPSSTVGRERLVIGADPVDLAAEVGLAASKSDARRALQQGGLYLNNERLAVGRSVGESDLLHGRFLLLRKGKSSYHLVVAG